MASAAVTIVPMEKPPYIPNSDEYGELQRFVDALFMSEHFVDNLDVQVMAETFDLPYDLLEVVSMLPRRRLWAPPSRRPTQLRPRRPRLDPALRHRGVTLPPACLSREATSVAGTSRATPAVSSDTLTPSRAHRMPRTRRSSAANASSAHKKAGPPWLEDPPARQTKSADV